MIKTKAVKLLINDENNSHHAVISRLMKNAKRFECAVAFAKIKGLNSIMPGLALGLASGLKARIVVGLSFYLTDPVLLRTLFNLRERFKDNFSFYVSDSDVTFHPKIYAISDNHSSTVLIGSANLTGGGMSGGGNYEASAQVDDPENKLFQAVVEHLDDLANCDEIVELTHAKLSDYEQLYNTYKMQQRLAKLRFDRMAQSPNAILETLQDFLAEMKRDFSESGFQIQVAKRSKYQNMAAREISALANVEDINSVSFLEHYERLIQCFHSGGLHRGKNIIAKNPLKFQSALKDLLKSKPESAQDAYKVLQGHFREIPRAGINVLTEILHAIDRQKFVVMNQNAVSGLRLAKYTNYPEKPSKTSVNAAMYADFCRNAAEVRDQLGLSDFTELDALFNYAYWEILGHP